MNRHLGRTERTSKGWRSGKRGSMRVIYGMIVSMIYYKGRDPSWKVYKHVRTRNIKQTISSRSQIEEIKKKEFI